jgi:hypothetical protein
MNNNLLFMVTDLTLGEVQKPFQPLGAGRQGGSPVAPFREVYQKKLAACRFGPSLDAVLVAPHWAGHRRRSNALHDSDRPRRKGR